MLERLTVFRLFAAVAVVIYHFGRNASPFDLYPLSTVIYAGPLAVSFFYVLSGFIMGSVYNSMQLANSGRYYWARICRIYPMYIVSLLLIIPYSNLSDKELLLFFTLSQTWFEGFAFVGNPVGWSLSVEIFFYLVFPFVIFAFQRLPFLLLALIVALIWVGSQITNTMLYAEFLKQQIGRDLTFHFPLNHLSTFLTGVLIGYGIKLNHLRLKDGTAMYCVLVGTFGVSACYWLSIQGNLLGHNLIPWNGLTAPFFGAICVGIYFWPSKVTESRIAHFCGEASYSLYLLQFPVFGIYGAALAQNFQLGPTATFYVCLTLLMFISAVSFQFIERPSRFVLKSKLPPVISRLRVQA